MASDKAIIADVLKATIEGDKELLESLHGIFPSLDTLIEACLQCENARENLLPQLFDILRKTKDRKETMKVLKQCMEAMDAFSTKLSVVKQ